LRIVYDGRYEHREALDVAVIPERLPAPVEFPVKPLSEH
jgi:hypothetical protein